MSGSGISAGFPALGTTAVVLTVDPALAEAARATVELEIADIDLACSRFRPDSELLALNAAAGRRVEVSTTLFAAVEAVAPPPPPASEPAGPEGFPPAPPAPPAPEAPMPEPPQ